MRSKRVKRRRSAAVSFLRLCNTSTGAGRHWLFTQWRIHRAQLRFCIRVTLAAILALLIAQLFTLPLHGL